MKSTQILIAAVLGLLLAGGGFAAGMTYQKGATPSASAAASGLTRFGGAGTRGGAGAQGATNGQTLLVGQVLSVNDGSITVQTRQPGAQGATPTVSSEIVLVGGSTRVVKTVETDASLSDVKANDQVTIVGTTDASGNFSASSILLGGNTLGGLFPGGRGGGPRPSPSPSPSR
jgi:hypothetical protein